MGDGAFLMSAAEIETAVREQRAVRDPGLGRRRVRADRLEAGHPLRATGGGLVREPGLRAARGELRSRGYAIGAADELLPTLRKALDDDVVSVIACPVDYRENARLIERLGALTEPI